MDNFLAVLKLTLDGLRIPLNFEESRHLHRAVYLAQICGLDLCYSFSWYPLGIYSAKLSHDHYHLSRLYSAGDRDHRALKLECEEQIRKARSLMVAPSGLPISDEMWVDTLASSHYLLTVSRTPWTKIDQTFQEFERGHLVPYLKDARARFIEHKLIYEQTGLSTSKVLLASQLLPWS
jgi:hypothetical protein